MIIMASTWFFLLAFFQVAVSTFLYNVSKRATAYSTRCSGCRPDQCDDKYAIFPGHTACLAMSPYARSVDLTKDDKIEIVKYHNALRGSVSPPPADMLKLEWDADLEMLAKRWAEACKKDDKGEFSQDTVRFIPGRFEVGQNIASKFETFREAINSWFQEKKEFEKLFDAKPVQTLADILLVGRYTQMVWAKTGLIGCAVAVCDNVPFYVCNYAPSGNRIPFLVPYEPAMEIGRKCFNRTPDGLCDCLGSICENAATIDVKQCKCTCKYPTSAGKICAMDCSNEDSPDCGTAEGLTSNDCYTALASFACPNMCGHCPCVAANYYPTLCSVQSDEATSVNYETFRAHKFQLVMLQLIFWLTAEK